MNNCEIRLIVNYTENQIILCTSDESWTSDEQMSVIWADEHNSSRLRFDVDMNIRWTSDKQMKIR